jgi:hypothetical protein
MKHANSYGLKILATPSAQGTCPKCGAMVHAKCGDHNEWHWAHLNTEDCGDTWSEPEGEWHLGWKDYFPKNWHEIVIGEHRADIRTSGGLVVELQHSPITPEVVAERENYYGDMIWIFDAMEYVERCEVVCWVDEHPNPIYTEGRTNPAFRLENLDQVLMARERFFASNGMPEELVDISEAPFYSRASSRENAIKGLKSQIKKASNMIVKWQEELNLDPANRKAKRFLGKWENDLTRFEAALKSREATKFLLKPFPVMEESPENIHFYGTSVSAWRIRFQWQHERGGNLACKKPVFWDVGSQDHLIFFPEGTNTAGTPNQWGKTLVFSALVVEKMVVLDAIKEQRS